MDWWQYKNMEASQKKAKQKIQQVLKPRQNPGGDPATNAGI